VSGEFFTPQRRRLEEDRAAHELDMEALRRAVRASRDARAELERRSECDHPRWTEEGDGHNHNYWRCAECGHTQWIAPWILKEKLPR
jgi:rubrerythrin